MSEISDQKSVLILNKQKRPGSLCFTFPEVLGEKRNSTTGNGAAVVKRKSLRGGGPLVAQTWNKTEELSVMVIHTCGSGHIVTSDLYKLILKLCIIKHLGINMKAVG